MPKPTGRQSFADWLRNFNNGALDDQLSAALAEVAADVVLLEKPGTVTLTLKLTDNAGGVNVEHDIKAAHPKSKNGQFFYIDSHGNLTRRDPNQPQIPTMEDHT